MNSNDLKKLATNVHLDKEIYDNCISCSTETHIANLSIVSGKCFTCENNTIKNKEVLKKMVEISKQMGEI